MSGCKARKTAAKRGLNSKMLRGLTRSNLLMSVLVIFALCVTIMKPICVFAQSGRTSEENNGVCQMEAEAATVTRHNYKVPRAAGAATNADCDVEKLANSVIAGNM